MRSGYIVKSKSAKKISEKELEMINKLTRRTFEEDEIYSFSVVLCDNDIDRDFDRFSDSALAKLSELYIGKTGVLDHKATSENQTARIFFCEIENVPEKTNKVGEPYKRLVAKAYMPKCEKNESTILEIDSGIKKEVSVGCAVENKICSICGKDLNQEKCAHKKGKKYRKNGKYEVCHNILENPTDAYEWSFVAVPAQPEAGVIKAFETKPFKGGEKNMEEIIKSLGGGEDVNLSAQECEKLTKMIKCLEQKASERDSYVEEIRNDVLKMSKILEPDIGENLIKSALENLSLTELQSLKKAFKSKISKSIPSAPQFAPEKPDLPIQKNTQFKI